MRPLWCGKKRSNGTIGSVVFERGTDYTGDADFTAGLVAMAIFFLMPFLVMVDHTLKSSGKRL
jgi:hypothetical protein